MDFSVYVTRIVQKFKAKHSRFVVSVLLIGVVFCMLGYLGLRAFVSRPLVQAAITTQVLGTTLSYAGIAITVQTVQRSADFVDDPVSVSDGMLRLHMRARNQLNTSVNLSYSKVMRLVLPDGQVIEPAYVKADGRLMVGKIRLGLLDFVVPDILKTQRLILRVGNVGEAWMDMPLSAHADLSGYLPKTIVMQQQMQYLGLNWSLSGVQVQWSLADQQAPVGQLYATLSIKVDNPLSQIVIAGSAYEYVSLKSLIPATGLPGGKAALIDSSLPVPFEPGVTGATGSLTFLIPQHVHEFLLVLGDVGQNQDGFQPATVDIQL